MLRFENGWEVWVLSIENIWGASVSRNGEHLLHLSIQSENRDEVVQYTRDLLTGIFGLQEVGR